ncbi:hypothetical protein EMCRGX_G014589 [Ephydatia muelleri]
MPEHKRIQGPEETRNPLLFLQTEEKSHKPTLDGRGCRDDGRKPNQIRPLFLQCGLNPHATGSVYLEHGKTKVLCTVYGPRDKERREDLNPEGVLSCEFKFLPFSCKERKTYQQDQEEKEFSTIIAQALQRAVKLDTFPKLQLEINVAVIENGGNALVAAILCASAALTDCGIEMFDLPVACSVVRFGTEFLVDPTVEEEYARSELDDSVGSTAAILLAYLPTLDEVTTLTQRGELQAEEVMKGIELCREGCLRIHQRMRDLLMQQVKAIS